MKLNLLFNIPGSKKNKKRVGRGIGSGSGKTCGRGVKGQKSRSGVAIKTEGGQMPLIKRLPKRGFSCSKSVDYTPITISYLEMLVNLGIIDSTTEVNKNLLVSLNFIKSNKVSVKLLAEKKDTTCKLLIDLDAYSKSAKIAVEKAGGKVI